MKHSHNSHNSQKAKKENVTLNYIEFIIFFSCTFEEYEKQSEQKIFMYRKDALAEQSTWKQNPKTTGNN